MFPIKSSISKFKFVIHFILLICVGSITNYENITENSKNETAKLFNKEILMKSETTKSRSKEPAPIYETLEIEVHKKHNFENESIFETVSSIQEFDDRTSAKVQRDNDGFKPSTFLGQIGEINFTGTIVNPFLKTNHVGSENVTPEIHHDTHQQSVRENSLKFFDTDNGYKAESVKTQPIQYYDQVNNLRSNQNKISDTHYSTKTPIHETKVIHAIISIKPSHFENANLEITENSLQNINIDQHNNDHQNIGNHNHQNIGQQNIGYQNIAHQQTVGHLHNVDHQHENQQNIDNQQYVDHQHNTNQYYTNIESQYPQTNLQKPYFIENTERPVVYENNIKFPNGEKYVQTYNQNYGHVAGYQLDHLQKPEFEFDLQLRKPELYIDSLRKPESSFNGLHSGLFGNWDHFSKPDNVVYAITHEVAHMKTKHFPYHFQHPKAIGEIPSTLELHPHDCLLKKNRISPWKKIFHILGTAIPIGLLLAAFTPKVITIDQNYTTEPNIVLLKTRSSNLPIEHRAGRISVNRDTCEEKAICETILEGGKSPSNLVQNALWNLSKRITDEIAKKNGLQEIFAAAKKKDCGSLTC